MCAHRFNLLYLRSDYTFTNGHQMPVNKGQQQYRNYVDVKLILSFGRQHWYMQSK